MIKENVVKAYNFAKAAHEGVRRKNSDLPYFVHPKMVARIVETMGGSEDMVAAALLHDVVEDTPYTEEDIRKEFGDSIADLVMEVTNMPERDNTELFPSRIHYMAHKMATISADALVIKLADRLNNVAYLDYDAENSSGLKFARYYADKTLATINRFWVNGGNREYNDVHSRLMRMIYDELERVLDYLNELGIHYNEPNTP